jgi:gas vesicle protein
LSEEKGRDRSWPFSFCFFFQEELEAVATNQENRIGSKGGKMSSSDWQKAASAFLVGVGEGTTVALLFAPGAGEQTRNRIAGAIRDGVDEVAAQRDEVTRQAKKTYAQAKEQVNDVVDAAQQGYAQGKAAAS